MPDLALQRLIAADLVRWEAGQPRTTRRWQSAMARAAARLYDDGLPYDLRYPITLALIEHLGALDDAELSALIEAMLPIEQGELHPLRASRPSGTTPR